LPKVQSALLTILVYAQYGDKCKKVTRKGHKNMLNDRGMKKAMKKDEKGGQDSCITGKSREM
jgi:hypothetical protein